MILFTLVHGDDFIIASDGQDVIFAGAGNDIYRVTDLPSQVDISQGAKMVDMSATINHAGNVVVGATFIGPDADAPHELNLQFTFYNEMEMVPAFGQNRG